MCDPVANPKTPEQKPNAMNTDIAGIDLFKKPDAVSIRKRAKQTVLTEETYIEEMGKIIERDFFPDLKKLKVQNTYLEAEKNKDTETLRLLYLKYASNDMASGANLHNNDNVDGSASVARPANDPLVLNFNVPAAGLTAADPIAKLSLDQFLARFTSEDNESFNEIMDAEDRKHREKFAYLALAESKANRAYAAAQNPLRIENTGSSGSGRRLTTDLITWPYKNENSLMFTPEGVAASASDPLAGAKTTTNSICYENTKIAANKKSSSSKMTSEPIVKPIIGHVGVDGNEICETQTPKIGGFSLVRTPSPAPGIDYTPLMTWGAIEGTPFRLDGSDTPNLHLNTPSFRIKTTSKREQIAHELADRASGHKRRSAKKSVVPPAASPMRLNRRERLSSMSPAAKKLMTSASRTVTTPLPSTPTLPNTIDGLVTDNLLKIKSPIVKKRKQASDFF